MQSPSARTTQTAGTRLLVIRHGESEWNAARRWQGQADVELNERGRLQAAEAGLNLGMFDALWASDLVRARLTAEIIGAIIGIGPVQVDQRLRETDVGPWEGLTHDEVNAGWPGFLDTFRRPEGFEDYSVAAERMMAAFADIATACPGGEVLVVTHGGVIRAVRRAVGNPAEPDIHIPNLGGCWFQVHPPAGHDDTARITAGEIVTLSTDVAGPAGWLRDDATGTTTPL
ncbi:MAG TPA: histidine phosphatase family protein [Ilumatobacteraceae bacterium]|nr:histidine phosphatase family protein [Ilumatobacteraceae bacterium]